MGHSLPLFFRIMRPVMLSGAAIYLSILGGIMLLGRFNWQADFIGSHGEPFLVIAFAVYAGFEAIWSLKNDSSKA